MVLSVLRGERHGVRAIVKRSLGTVAYATSGIAAVLHLSAAWSGDHVPAALGMRLLTYTFVVLVVPLAAARSLPSMSFNVFTSGREVTTAPQKSNRLNR